MSDRDQNLHIARLGYSLEMQIAAMRAACIEWKYGDGAEHAMEWIENTLDGPDLLPDVAETGTDAQAFFDAESKRISEWLRGIEDAAKPKTGWDALSDDDKAEWRAMVAEMRNPETAPCGCGYPRKECLRVVLRNGPPYPPRPCEPVVAAPVAEDSDTPGDSE